MGRGKIEERGSREEEKKGERKGKKRKKEKEKKREREKEKEKRFSGLFRVFEIRFLYFSRFFERSFHIFVFLIVFTIYNEYDTKMKFRAITFKLTGLKLKFNSIIMKYFSITIN